ncbi:MAG TPA: beta-ketoacyl-[acyl-carrier-protein] synthase family protein [bacterium]|nr:beta-ketoacyl-[acyl-carrier-protein] synthase family protein [bacterium]
MKKRVVVTGMGVVTPIGNALSEFAENLKRGLHGEGLITSFDVSNFPVKRAFEVKNFDRRKHGTHLLDPFIQYAVAATADAITDAGFDMKAVDPFRVGISVSSSKGGVHTLDRFRERLRRNPSPILGARIYVNSVPNFAAQWIARRWKVQGPSTCYVAACATGTVSVIEGARMVREGLADYCIAGASDASIVPLMLAGYSRMKALAKGPMLPFDKRRGGFLVGEGAGIVFLETLESAKARGVKIYGEILGSSYGNDCSGGLVHFKTEEEALAKTVEHLLKQNHFGLDELNYVNLHGTATRRGDVYETHQIKKVFGRKAYQIPMSSTKSVTGHMLGASGAVEIIACLLALQEGFIPPTAGLEKHDPACDLDYTPLKSKSAKLQTALSLSMGFGGHIAAIALRKI